MKECCNCHKKIWAMVGHVNLADGAVCTECYAKTGLSTWNGFQIAQMANVTCDNMLRMIRGLKPLTQEDQRLIAIRKQNTKRIQAFKPTKIVGSIRFSDISNEFMYGRDDTIDIFHYESIVDYELLENGGVISKGSMGSAVVGGLLFGETGAVIGAAANTRKTVNICNSLLIKVTLRNEYKNVIYFKYIGKETATSTTTYKEAFTLAQNTMSMFKLDNMK